MDSLRTEHSWFVAEMIRVTTDMWRKGWDERNGGNVSLRLTKDDIASYLPVWNQPRVRKLTEPVQGLDGECFLVTGTGAYFRNVEREPEQNLGVIRVLAGGEAIEILWGFGTDGGPTSELPAHLKSHYASQSREGAPKRVIMHCHATNLVSLSYVLELTTSNLTRALWEGSTECLVVFPDGIGTLEWMVPGTDSIGDATAALLAQHPLALWPFHGVFASGTTLNEAFGLIDTVEKASELLVKTISMGGPRQTISTQNLIDLARHFGVKPLPSALALNGWRLAPHPAEKPRKEAALFGTAGR
ncbi:rhamnulose-1-phosphate aldolase [Rhizomicrobium electricum]|uniref:Rhamnulose-1-phosphate aldolase n=1 Tax=Rhizomicrobium electricum TaxID=480070 RepID=A0ABN1EA18_9PROT|nr:rhamnulose-1-phosphate aldolase [Rhizomicrobium electricum]NIJ48046.1 rhamnulose-1-phosphate aldolase [Rhizomicrobium electricum]